MGIAGNGILFLGIPIWASESLAQRPKARFATKLLLRVCFLLLFFGFLLVFAANVHVARNSWFLDAIVLGALIALFGFLVLVLFQRKDPKASAANPDEDW